MKRRTRASLLFATAAALSIAGHASAASIGIDFVQNNNGGIQNASVDSLAPTELAGAPGYTQTNWNNCGRWGGDAHFNLGNGINCLDSVNTSSGVYLSWDASTVNGTGIATDTPNRKLMRGYLNTTGQTNGTDNPYTFFGAPDGTHDNRPNVYASGLSAWLAAKGAATYSVVVYSDSTANNGVTRTGEFWLQNVASVDGGHQVPNALGSDLTPHVFLKDVTNFDSTFTQVPLTANSEATAVAGNYIVFTNLSADTFILRTEEWTASDGNKRAVINGFQIAPEYTSPVVDVQPTQQPAGTLYTGQSFSMSVVAVGAPTLSYQWRKNGTNVTGENATAISRSNITTADSADYDVVVSNSFGSVTSSIVTIAVNSQQAPFNAVVSPASATRIVGTKISFSVTTGGTAPFTYQWKKGGTSILSATNSTLTLANLSTGDSASYTCAVTNFIGGTLSSAGVLTVQPAAGTSLGVNFSDGGEVVSATAFGVDPTNWFNPVGPNGVNQTNGSLVLTWSSPNTWRQGFSTPGEGEVLYGYLDDGNPNSATVSGLNTVFNQYVIQAMGATDSGSGLANVAVTNGSQTLSYPSPQSNGGGGVTAVSTVSAPLNDDAFKLNGGSSGGGVRACLAGFIITDKPVITAQPQPPGGSVFVGGSFSITGLNVVGVPAIAYQWRKDNVNIANATNAVFAKSGATLGDAGGYDVVVTNAYGSVTSSVVTLSVNDAPPSNSSVTPVSVLRCLGGAITFSVTADGSTPFTYQWYKDGSRLGAQTNSTLLLPSVQPGDAGNYTCAVTNSVGGEMSSMGSLTTGNCSATTIAINFMDAGETVTAPAFGVNTADWVNLGNSSGSQNLGNLTVTWTSANTWRQGPIPPAPGEEEVLHGYLDDGGSQNSVVISGLVGTFSGAYVIQTLAASDNAGAFQDVIVTNGPANLTYPNPVFGTNGATAISTPSAAMFADTVKLQGQPWVGVARGSLAGFIITDKPVIERQPQVAGTVYATGTLNLTGLQVLAAPTLTYQWRRNGSNIGGANGATYTKSGVAAGDAGNYDVVVANSFGTLTSSVAVVTITALPTVAISQAGTNFTLSWTTGTLLEATNVTGPWTANGAASPFTNTPSGSRKFYRLLVQ